MHGPQGYARGLYAALRELDLQANELIVVENIPDAVGWAAVADRLRLRRGLSAEV